MTEDVVNAKAIESEICAAVSVSSSIAKRLGIDQAATAPVIKTSTVGGRDARCRELCPCDSGTKHPRQADSSTPARLSLSDCQPSFPPEIVEMLEVGTLLVTSATKTATRYV
jgi:hypothetical protein